MKNYEFLAAKAIHEPTPKEVMAHFGYEEVGEWHSTWLNKPGQIERLSALPEVIKMLGVDRKCRIIFDYDPNYPKMLLQATVSDSTDDRRNSAQLNQK